MNRTRIRVSFTQYVSCRAGDCSRVSPRRSIRLLLPAAAFVLLSNPAAAQDLTQQAKVSLDQANKTVETLPRYVAVSYKSGRRRDPFLNPLITKKGANPDEQEEARGLPPPGIAGTYIAQATLQGIVIRDDARVAIVRGSDSRAYFLREGDRLFDGYLKSIENDSVLFVRETKMRSGRIFTQDVTKRLRTP